MVYSFYYHLPNPFTLDLRCDTEDIMDCLIELYDHEQLNNLVDILAFRPKKAVFLYDKRETRYEDIHAVETACKQTLPDIRMEAVAMNTLSLDEITNTCKQVIRNNSNCYMDITGGGELSAIGAYLACRDAFTPIFKVDVVNGIFINAYGCKSMEETFSLPTLSLDTLLLAHGAALGGTGHPKPSTDWFDPLFTFCQTIFEDLSRWKDLCFYLQTGCTSHATPYRPLSFSAPSRLSAPGGKQAAAQLPLLEKAADLGLITKFSHINNMISFEFGNESIKKYLTDYGTCLELYTYITLCKAGVYDDVRMSVKVDWNGIRPHPVEITNEIDVTFFCGIHPVFLSCKLSEPSSEALQELSVYKSYFGGRHSRCILVTLAVMNPQCSYSLWRAKEMGISVIDGTSIQKGTFLQDLERAIGNKRAAAKE